MSASRSVRSQAWIVGAPLVVGGLSLWFGLTIGVTDDLFISVMLWLAPLFAFLAAIIAVRVPGNVIAWLLLSIALSIPVAGLFSLAIPEEAPTEPSVFLGVAVAVVGGSWMGFIMPILLILFLFPTGEFLSRRWAWAGWLAGLMVATFTFLSFFVAEWGGGDVAWTVENPYGFIDPSIWAEDGWFTFVWLAGLVALALGGLVAMVVRYRRSTVVGRTQIRWFVVPAIFFAVFYAISAAIPGERWTGTTVFQIGFGVTFFSLPLAMTIAITKYRLYEIDRILSRSVTYVLVLAVMVGAYVLALLAIGSVVPTDGDLQVAIATLVAVGVSVPLGRRIRRWVDRRFHRSTYDAASVVAGFAGFLGGTIDRDALVARTKETVDSALAPDALDVWLEGSA